MKKDKNISDASLIDNYLKGDVKSLALLVKRWHQTFCKLAYWYVKDSDLAKDIAQECWTVIMSKIGTLEDREKFKSWAISLVNRKSMDYLRNIHREQRKRLEIRQEMVSVIEHDLDATKEKKKLVLLRGIQQLTTDQQYIIRLFYVENYSLKEIAEILEISLGTVKSRLFYAREKLKSLIQNKQP
jgi:RNA polymerase sigma-70 factor (ECF subfamily)